MLNDYYVSQYSGEEIDALLGGAGAGTVRYDAAQALTDEQKAQARNNISAMQGIESTDHPGCNYVLNGSTVEWINPPMQLGVEYRTTERYLGKPVYVKLVDCGQIADSKTVDHGISDMNLCLSFRGRRGGEPMPQIYNHSLNDAWTCYVSDVTRTRISLACGSSSAGGNCAVMLKYIKTTD